MPQQDNKIQTGLRIPQDRYETLKDIADRSGLSLNAVILSLVDIGLSTVNRGIQEANHAPLHNQQHKSE